VFAPVVVAQVKAIACSLPAEQGLPISSWTCAEIAQEAVKRGVVGSLSASTVRRILDEVAAAAPPPPSPVVTKGPEGYRSEAQPEFDVQSVLGPPPGPQPDRRPERVAAPQDRYAFLVGITDYSRPTVDTIGGAADVRFIARRLELAGWSRENIRVLTDSRASGRAVRDGMAWLAGEGAPARSPSSTSPVT